MTDLRFGTDGWRGIIADDFTFENLRRMVRASALYMMRHPVPGAKSIVIGYDRRFLSPSFARQAADGFAQQGHRVRLASAPLPTPAVSVCVKDAGAAWGVMITASHNPPLYNGYKLKDGHGRSAPPYVTRAIESLLPDAAPDAPDQPQDIPTFDFLPAYLRYLRGRLDWTALKTYKGKVLFDYLHGVGAGIPERLLKGLPLTLIALHDAWDVLFGGLHPEPIEANLGRLKQEVRRRRASVGIALDGDADRLGIVDERGRCLTPHQVFPLLVLHGIEHKGWRGKIVQSLSLGMLGERIADHYGLAFEEVPVGFKHIAERMIHDDVLAGGEESGGYAVRGGLPERDGILSGLLFLEMLAARRRTTSQLLAEMEKRFGAARFRRVDLPLGAPLEDAADFTQSIVDRIPERLAGSAVRDVRRYDGVKIVLADGAWVLLRPSGTEPLLRTYAESSSWLKTGRLLGWARRLASSMARAPVHAL